LRFARTGSEGEDFAAIARNSSNGRVNVDRCHYCTTSDTLNAPVDFGKQAIQAARFL
jgi:hypothetical protein